MNKKFSTLAASLMLASAFSFHAQATNIMDGVKSGEYVVLNVGSKALTVGNQSVLEAPNSLDDLIGNVVSVPPRSTFAEQYAALNKALWRVEVVEQTSTTGKLPNLYRFVNKETGEYLAIKLKTNTVTEDKKFTTDKAVKLDASGNTLWSLKDNVLSAYVPNAEEGKDSTFVLGTGLKLFAEQGTVKASDALTLGTESEMAKKAITLNAVNFNGIMAYIGSNGKLNFNNDKDVTSNEENVIKDTKWIAKDLRNNKFALTDGTTQPGVKDAPKADGTFESLDKLNYLQVDTLFHNDKDGFFKLKKDTLPTEYNATAKAFAANEHKPRARRNAAAAEFTGEFFIANDSIVLTAVNMPKPIQAYTYVDAESELTKYDADYSEKYAAALGACAKNSVLESTINALDAKYLEFLAANNNGSQAVTFLPANQSLVDAVKAANATNNADVTAYVNLFNSLSQAAAHDEPGKATPIENYEFDSELLTSATFPTADVLNKAYLAFLDGSNNGGTEIAFKDAYFDAQGAYKGRFNTGSDKTGQELITALGTAISTYDASDATTSARKAAAFSYRDLMTANTASFKMAAKHSVAGKAEAISDYDTKKTNALSVAAEKTALKEALKDVDAKYTEFVAQEGELFENELTFNAYAANEIQALGSGYPAEVTTYLNGFGDVKFARAQGVQGWVDTEYFTNGSNSLAVEADVNAQVVLRKLGKGVVLTLTREDEETTKIALEENGYTIPMIQPYATAGGDATLLLSYNHC